MDSFIRPNAPNIVTIMIATLLGWFLVGLIVSMVGKSGINIPFLGGSTTSSAADGS